VCLPACLSSVCLSVCLPVLQLLMSLHDEKATPVSSNKMGGAGLPKKEREPSSKVIGGVSANMHSDHEFQDPV